MSQRNSTTFSVGITSVITAIVADAVTEHLPASNLPLHERPAAVDPPKS